MLIAGAGFAGPLDNPPVDPGTVRFSHELLMENVLHRNASGVRVEEDGLNKTYTRDASANSPWKSEWGQSLLTEVATRPRPDIFGRVLFQAQADYADRYWRPVNIDHHLDESDRVLLLRQAEAKVTKEKWNLHAFRGVEHNDWSTKGDLFRLYPASYPDGDYLGYTGFFGITPQRFSQDVFLNISRRHAPQGVTADAQMGTIDGSVAVGRELSWGYEDGFYGRLSGRLFLSRWTFVYRREDVPTALPGDPDRKSAYALGWKIPTADRNTVEWGVLYQPFRIGDTYSIARDVPAGEGLQGSGTAVTTRTVGQRDAFAYKAKWNRGFRFRRRDAAFELELTRAEIVAGNKQEAKATLATPWSSSVKTYWGYTYRKPIEGPLPFLYEGTPSNIGAVVLSPRGPEAPFTVGWNNRQASIWSATFVFDPTPETSFFIYNSDALQIWNLNPEEDAPAAVAVQMSFRRYFTSIDRSTYYDEEGNIQFESAGQNGAWASDGYIPELRLLFVRVRKPWRWTWGGVVGEDMARLGSAYRNPARTFRPIARYYALEARADRRKYAVWAHGGRNLWGPEDFQQSAGSTFSRVWGLGATYRFSSVTAMDVNYLSVRSDDDRFFAPDLGSYDEIRTVFSHRFGYAWKFQRVSRPVPSAR